MNDDRKTRARTCPICGAAETRPLGVRDSYDVARCLSCDHSFTENVPEPAVLAAIYERYSYDVQHLEALPPFLITLNRERVRTFEPWRRTGRLLDVGFGAGVVLKAAKEEGWDTYGIETSRVAVEQAKQHELGHILQADLRSAPFEDGLFDVVVMSELVEHLPDPLAFLEAARRLLMPGGLLYLTTPHGRGISGRLLKTTWSVCAPPEHLHLFSRRSITRALEQAGFEPEQIETRNLNPQELIRWVKRPFARQGGQPFAASERVEGGYRMNAALVGSPWGRIAKRAVSRVLDVTTLGDGLVVHAIARGGTSLTPPRGEV